MLQGNDPASARPDRFLGMRRAISKESYRTDYAKHFQEAGSRHQCPAGMRVACNAFAADTRLASLGRGRRLPVQHLEIISAQSALPAVKFCVVATPNPSLIERKERWARKMAGKIRAHHGESSTGSAVRAGQADFQAGSRRSTDRLPPGQHLTQGFPILDLGIKPEIALADWRLEIGGLVETPKTFTWEEFNALPQFEDVSDFHCVTTWSKFDCRWRGVAFFTLAEIVKPKPEVRHVLFSSYDGYTTNVRIEDALDDDTLVATQFDGKPIPRDHGGPARVIIPKLYAWKGAKFVRAIQFLAEDQPGFWEVRGYSNTADPWTEDRFSKADS